MNVRVETTPLLSHTHTTDHDFLEYILEGSTEEALLALDHGLNPNCKDSEGTNALCLAISFGNAELVEKLLQCGADITTGNISSFHGSLKAKDIPGTPSTLINWTTAIVLLLFIVDYVRGPLLPDPLFFGMSIVSVAEYAWALTTYRRLDALRTYLLGYTIIIYILLHLASFTFPGSLSRFPFALLHSRSWWTYPIRAVLSSIIQTFNLSMFKFMGVYKIINSPGRAALEAVLEYQGSGEEMFLMLHDHGIDLGDPEVVDGNLVYRIWLWATQKVYVRVAHRLLEMGLPAFMHAPYADEDILGKEEEENIPIVSAAYACNPAMLSLLFDFGAALYSPKVMNLALVTCVRESPSDSRVESSVSTISLLLKYGADPNATDNEGRSALSWTCDYSASENTALPLLTSGARDTISSVDRNGRTALHHAAWKHPYSSNKIIAMLLDANAPIDTLDSQGHTPLWFAASLGWPPDVVLLLQRGASIDYCGPDSSTPLMEACRHGDMITISILLAEGANPNAQTHDETPLISALWRQWSEPMDDVVRVLLDAGANPLMPPDFPCQPLVESVETTESEGDFMFEILEAIRSHGTIPVDVLNQALIRTIESIEFRLDTVRALVIAGADPRTRSSLNKDRTVLHAVHEREYIESRVYDNLGNETYQAAISRTVPILLSHGASLDDQDRDGCTPFHIAIDEAKIFTVKEMVRLGTNLHAVDGCFQTPLHHACKKTASKWTGYTPLGYHPDLETPEFSGPRMQRVKHAHIQERVRLVLQSISEEDIVAILLQHGADPFALDQKGMTSFYLACQVGNPITAGVLLQNRSRARRELEGRVTYSLSQLLQARDLNGTTPLHWAAKSGNIEVVRMILAADLSTSFRTGENTFQDIVRPPQHFALDSQAINAQDSFGKTPIQYAHDGGHHHIVNLFLEEVGVSLHDSRADEQYLAITDSQEDLHIYLKRIQLPGRWCNIGCRWCVYQWGWLKH